MMYNDVDFVLGKQVNEYKQEYDPKLLAREPRSRNRIQYDITGKEFIGVDVWHCYEASFLLNNGMPQQGVLKIIYPSASEFIVESKSLKMYLFSLMMTAMGSTVEKAEQTYVRHIKTDLSELLGTDVTVKYFSTTTATPRLISSPVPADSFLLDNIVTHDKKDINKIRHYEEAPDLLLQEPFEKGVISYHSHALRSRCKITSQPDWGTVYINMQGPRLPSYLSLYKYIVSFRNENHFHEEIVEAVYKRLQVLFKPAQITVAAFYTRRGGIDINPVRTSNENLTNGIGILPPLTNIKDINYRVFRS